VRPRYQGEKLNTKSKGPHPKKWRHRLYELVDFTDENGDGGHFDWYDIFMLVAIIVSIIPLLFKQSTPLLEWFDRVTVIIFIIDYALRWMTADIRSKHHDVWAFVRYPFTFMAIMDLLSIIPSLTTLSDAFKLLKIFRMLKSLRLMRTLKVLRVMRTARYSRQLKIIVDVLENSKEALLAVCTLSAGYIFILALIVFNVEPDTFATFFDAVYWATISLTTVGYGDIYLVSTIGKAIAMISSLFGIAIVALPAGIITAGYMTELNKRQSADTEIEEKPEKKEKMKSLRPEENR
jgi:voltage-gated potassium channel